MAGSDPHSLAPGVLWSKIQHQTRHALACGALQPIRTEYEFVEQGGIRFLVRVLANLMRKEQYNRSQVVQHRQGKPVNPFLPYDPDLFVADLSDSHLCLLNKYNVVDHHILIVTRAFEEQDTWLALADFDALAPGRSQPTPQAPATGAAPPLPRWQSVTCRSGHWPTVLRPLGGSNLNLNPPTSPVSLSPRHCRTERKTTHCQGVADHLPRLG
jgi:hypothetical protein